MTALSSGIIFMTFTIMAGAEHCAWDEYYDPHVDNCAPCSEICDAMTVSGTERQCKRQCSDYLTSRNCRRDEYFDEVVRSCAPCHELCGKKGEKGMPAEECSRQCHDYLVGPSLAGNSRSQAPTANTHDGGSGNGCSNGGCDEVLTSSTSWIPGIAATAAVSLIALTALTGFVVYTRRTAGVTRERDTLDSTETVQLNYPTPVSSTEDAVGDINVSHQRLTSSAAASDEVAGPERPEIVTVVELGIPECDPIAPSSAAHLFVCQQQCS